MVEQGLEFSPIGTIEICSKITIAGSWFDWNSQSARDANEGKLFTVIIADYDPSHHGLRPECSWLQ